MSVVGFDFGNESAVVAVGRQRGIEVVLNDKLQPETPAVVWFGYEQRCIGTKGAAYSLRYPKNTIIQIKRLIGRKFSDPELQQDLKSLPFLVREGPDGYPLIHAQYLGKSEVFTPTQVLGMVLSKLKIIAEKNLKAEVADCCIGIPVYFTDFQRRAVIDAATIAGLRPLRLIHETTATAFAYGIFKTDLPENEPLNVAFVDVGHSSLQVCIAAFKKGQLKILSHSFDRSLGGRNFDEVLFKYFAAKFKDEYKIDVYQNAKDCLKLRAVCEKLKKVLSTNPEACLNIKRLMKVKDIRGFIMREEFEQISVPILERVKKPLEKALADAGLTVENIHSVEVVGSGSQVPAIIKILTEFFWMEPSRTMNASECVAKGCTLQCAILSPTFRVREYQVNESFPFSISLTWKVSSGDAQNGMVDNLKRTMVFPKGNLIPSRKALIFRKALTFLRSEIFTLDVQYANASELQVPAKISQYMIGPFKSTNSQKAKLKVIVRLNLHGIVSVESATLLEEEEIEVSVSKESDKEPTKMDTDSAPSSTAVSEDKPVQMETDAKVEATKKKVIEKNVPVSEVVFLALATSDVKRLVEKESEMASRDRVMEETKEKKYAVEAYVSDMSKKLHDRYHDFVTDSERAQLITRLQEVHKWLYKDIRGKTKDVYVAKLEELKKQGDPIEERYKEHVERGSVLEQLIYCINRYREVANSNDPKFDRIDLAEKQKVLNECMEAQSWMREKNQLQESMPKHANPALLSADVRKKMEALDRCCSVALKPHPLLPQ